MATKELVPAYGDNTCRPDFCTRCPISHHTRGYLPLQRGIGGTTLVVAAAGESDVATGHHLSGGSGSWMNNILGKAFIKKENINVLGVLGCQPRDGVYPTDRKWKWTGRDKSFDAVRHCLANHFWPQFNDLNPPKVIALGDAALTALTGRKAIAIWRGSPLPVTGGSTLRVMPTFDPDYLMRDANMVSIVINDLKKKLEVPPELYDLYDEPTALAEYSAPVFAFDLEWDHNSDITICGISDRMYQARVGAWTVESAVQYRRIFEAATDLIGHNIIGADTTHFEKLGWAVPARMHDTMLKQHLVQPNFRHSLAFVSSVFTNKVFWKGRGEEYEDADGTIIEAKEQWKTWDRPNAIPRSLGGYGGCVSADEAYRLYNARDTDASFQINLYLDQLLKRYSLEHVYWNVSVPIAYVVRELSDRGLVIDPSRVSDIRNTLGTAIAELELTLPEGLKPYEIAVTKQVAAPAGTYKAKTLRCKGTKKAGTSHPLTEYTCETPGAVECPVCLASKIVKLPVVKKLKVPGTERIVPWNSSAQVMSYAQKLGLKMYTKRATGNAAADVNARKWWGRTNAEFRIIDELKDKITLRNSFARQTMESESRLYFNLLVHGTSEGRFSSSGKRRGIDPNIQNQPEAIRRIYIPDNPDWSFIELDYASGENMLTAFLARDFERLERLRSPGYSEHAELAKRIFNLPSDITKSAMKAYGPDAHDLYDVGKHINHGSNYGMTWVKLKEYLEVHGFFYTEGDCKEFMQIGKDLNPRTAVWQAETVEIAKRDGVLTNVFGRKRWFSSRSVATESLAFLPASTLADIIIRAMIGHYPSRFVPEIAALGLGITAEIMPEWLMSIQIHDSLVLQGPHGLAMAQAGRTKSIMEQPWRELDGFSLAVECKVGKPGASWGELEGVKL